MKYLLLLLAAAMPTFGQMTEQPQAILTHGAGDTVNLDWQGLAARSYFLQYSEDLQTWNYFPLVELGTDETISYGFSSTANKFFVRLQYTDVPTDDPENADFDGDGLSNIDEITMYHTNPFNPDTDGDGMIDGYEVQNGLDPNDDGSVNPANGAMGDKDGDGTSNIQEAAANTNPNDSTDHPLQLLAATRKIQSNHTISGSTQTSSFGTTSSWDSAEPSYTYSDDDFPSIGDQKAMLAEAEPYPESFLLGYNSGSFVQLGGTQSWNVYQSFVTGYELVEGKIWAKVGQASLETRTLPFLVSKIQSTPINDPPYMSYSYSEEYKDVVIQAGETVSEPFEVSPEFASVAGTTYTTSYAGPIRFYFEHFENIKDENGNDTAQVVAPGVDKVYRDEVANLYIQAGFAPTERTLKLSLETVGMRNETLGSRGSVQMYDFGTIGSGDVVTSLTTNSTTGATISGPEYDVTMPPYSVLNLRAVFNKEGTFRLRLKSPDGKFDVLSQEFTVINRTRKYSEKVDAATDKKVNAYDDKFANIASYWPDWKYKDNTQSGNFTFMGSIAELEDPELLKSICYTESNMNTQMAAEKSPIPNDLMQVDAGNRPATPSMNGSGKDWNDAATTVNITVKGGAHDGEHIDSYILDDNSSTQTTTEGAALVRMRYNNNSPGPAAVNSVDLSIRWAVRELIYKRFAGAIPANTIVEAKNDSRNFIIQKPTPLGLEQTLNNYGTGAGYGQTILNLKNKGLNPHDDGPNKLYLWPILANGKARGNN